MTLVSASKLPRQLQELFTEYAHVALDMRTGFYYSTLSEWQVKADRLLNHINSIPQISGLEKFELEEAEKGTVCWRDKGLGALLMEEDKTVSIPEQGKEIRSELSIVKMEIMKAISTIGSAGLREVATTARVPIARGKGAPYWYGGNDKLAGIHLYNITRSSRNADEFLDRLYSAGQAKMPLCITSYLRIQGSSKRTKDWLYKDGYLTQDGPERRRPKLRRVQATSFALNVHLTKLGEILKTLSQKGDQAGKIDSAVAYSRKYKYSVAVDLSRYDESVSIESLKETNEAVIHPVLWELARREVMTDMEIALAWDLINLALNLPLLCPSHTNNCGGEMYTVRGTVPSGIRLTSWYGTIINKCRIRAKAKHLGIKKFDFCNFGDDTIIFSDDPKILDWNKESEWIGFKETTSPTASYLMKQLPAGYSYVSRMLFGTLNKEARKEPSTPITAATGIATRAKLLIGNPYYNKFWEGMDIICTELHQRAALSIAKTVDYNRLLLDCASQKFKSVEEVADLIHLIESVEERRLLEPSEVEFKSALEARIYTNLVELTKLADTFSYDKSRRWIA